MESLLRGLCSLVMQQSLTDLTAASMALAIPFATLLSSPAVPKFACEREGSNETGKAVRAALSSIETTSLLLLKRVFRSFPW